MSTTEDKVQIETMRHSTAHLMAAAILSLWPEAKFGVGPDTRDGFYYDVDVPLPLTESDLRRIEAKMAELKQARLPYERIELGIDEAIMFMESRKQPYKVELLHLLRDKGSTAVAQETGDDAVAGGSPGVDRVSFYRLGDFVDLCRGPHVHDTSEIGAFRLNSIAGAYWRGKESNPQLQRIYGLAFENQAALEHRIWQLEEARKRDNRVLGKQLELFTISDDVGSGLPIWLPNGTILREELEALAKRTEHKAGYLRIATPHITKDKLYYRSGHLPYYADDMYAPISIEGVDYYLKPMNCPHHHQVFLARPRSYRELPLRLAEYGQVYRYEASGVLAGIMRTRGFQQNDAHIYCSEEQAEEEFIRVMRMHAEYYDLFDIKNYYMRFSKPDLERLDKYVNEPAKWIRAMEIVESAMKRSGYRYVEASGEAAFYGPKIDFMIESVVGTEYAISTNQLDFLATERFDLEYVGADGKMHPVYVIHRAPLGSHERFIAFLIEHYAGAFPTWLAPVQAVVIPIADRHLDYGKRVVEQLRDADLPTALGGLRCELDDDRQSMQKKIRNAQGRKIPYMLVIGDKEQESGAVSVRVRSGRDLGPMPLSRFIERVDREVRTRRDLTEDAQTN